MHFIRKTKTGADEFLTPHEHRNGKYKVEIEVDSLADVKSYALKGCSVRVRVGKGANANLINVTGMRIVND